ncbi:MAG: elongation factor P [Candidatus Omnitrophica bacterium]|nr:elongation factor P [Candidatus Omnitrophota bacterium]
MAISINEISSGIGLMVDGNIFVVEDYSHVKPGKGSAFVRVRMRNMKTQQVLERTFKTSERLEDLPLEERKLQSLYRSGDDYHFMDLTSYEEKIVPVSMMGDGVRFLQENLEVVGTVYNENILKVHLPTFIITEIVQSDPGLKGDSSKSSTKAATIDTGATVQVPLFINVGDKIKVDTRSGTYIERVKQ